MPKKAKKRLGKKKAPKKAKIPYVKPRRVATAGQLINIHNQSLRNTARDQAELVRQQNKIKEEQKTAKLELEKQVLERQLQQLNPFGFLG